MKKNRTRTDAMYVESFFEGKKYVGAYDSKGELIRHIDLTQNNFHEEEEIQIQEPNKQNNKNQLTFF